MSQQAGSLRAAVPPIFEINKNVTSRRRSNPPWDFVIKELVAPVGVVGDCRGYVTNCRADINILLTSPRNDGVLKSRTSKIFQFAIIVSFNYLPADRLVVGLAMTQF